MSLVDWYAIGSFGARDRIQVDYSHLHLPHDPFELDQDVARIRLAHDYIVDIEWSDEAEQYIVTLSRRFFEYDITTEYLDDVEKVVELVVGWINYYCQDSDNLPVSDASNTIQECMVA